MLPQVTLHLLEIYKNKTSITSMCVNRVAGYILYYVYQYHIIVILRVVYPNK